MENFYNLLKITPNSSRQDVINAYKNSIKRYTQLKMLDSEQIQNIRSLKIALYVLCDDSLRLSYDNLLSKVDNINPSNNEYDDIDSQFNNDKSWMNNVNNMIANQTNNNTSNNGRKNKGNNNMIGDRIFSLQELNKRPLYPVEYKFSN